MVARGYVVPHLVWGQNCEDSKRIFPAIYDLRKILKEILTGEDGTRSHGGKNGYYKQ